MSRYVCIHGHFYQPPRENPWLESVERQESAHPYHDWNARVTAECYAPNAASRLFDDRHRIVEIVNNYARISFNFGATLLSWMERSTRFTYGAILEADRESIERFGGHGSAIAQGHGHVIMPLASPRDRRTQVRWGIRDFQARFGRDPEGMWLPETAVDTDTLEALAEQGIAFTVLAPRQAAAVRPLAEDGSRVEGDEGWHDVTGERVDPARPYRVHLPSGRTITVFFYDGPISRAVAFEELSRNGDRLADRLLGVLGNGSEEPRLVHVAVDGETFGHHHMGGELALSYALRKLERTEGVELINYGAFLERHPPTWEARIVEDSSWSCVHGVERWRSDCGCSTGGLPRWNQAWRAPLRAALDGLRERIDPAFEAAAAEIFTDPWEARDDYIDVVLDRSDRSVDAFLAKHACGPADRVDVVRALRLMELQRHAMTMYTSCGWFFSELSGIETTQVLHYAARVVQLAEELFGESPEPDFLRALEAAPSNIPEKGNGRRIYEQWIRPLRVDLPKVAAHYASRSAFRPYEGDGEAEIHCYRVGVEEEDRDVIGRSQLLTGWGTFRSTITRDQQRLSYAAVYTGDHTGILGVRPFRDEESERAVREELSAAFRSADLANMVRIMDREYTAAGDALRALFRDEQQEVINQILESSVREAEEVLQDLYHRSAPLMRFAAELGVEQPSVFQTAADAVLRKDVEDALAADPPDLDRLAGLLEEARERGVHLEPDDIRHAAGRALETLADRAAEEPDDLDRVGALVRGTALFVELEFPVIVWGAQNTVFRMIREGWAERSERAGAGDEEARRWIEAMTEVAENLSIAIP